MLPASYLIFDFILGIKESYKVMVSGERKNRQEELSVQPLNLELELISISQITLPESQEKYLPPERDEALFNSLIDQDSSLIPLLVRLIEFWVWENLKCSKAYYIRLSLF